jgi:hypothetical protein
VRDLRAAVRDQAESSVPRPDSPREEEGLPLPGADVMIFKIFSPKKIAKKLAFLTHNKAKLCKKF